MVTSDHKTYVYVGLAGEGDYIGEGGIVRRADGDEQWQDISKGLPDLGIVRESFGYVLPLFITVGTADDPTLTDVIAFTGQADVNVCLVV